jgi:hypothetical protein
MMMQCIAGIHIVIFQIILLISSSGATLKMKTAHFPETLRLYTSIHGLISQTAGLYMRKAIRFSGETSS